jgi:hypothetical protein
MRETCLKPDKCKPLNSELNPIRHLLALVGARHIVQVSRIRVKTLLLSFLGLNSS